MYVYQDLQAFRWPQNIQEDTEKTDEHKFSMRASQFECFCFCLLGALNVNHGVGFQARGQSTEDQNPQIYVSKFFKLSQLSFNGPSVG